MAIAIETATTLSQENQDLTAMALATAMDDVVMAVVADIAPLATMVARLMATIVTVPVPVPEPTSVLEEADVWKMRPHTEDIHWSACFLNTRDNYRTYGRGSGRDHGGRRNPGRGPPPNRYHANGPPKKLSSRYACRGNPEGGPPPNSYHANGLPTNYHADMHAQYTPAPNAGAASGSYAGCSLPPDSHCW